MTTPAAGDPVEEPPSQGPDAAGLRPPPSLVLVNTGDGKGKSTAAFGTLLRAVAVDWKVAVVQFLKSGDWRVGEEKVCRSLGVDWFAAGDGFTWDSTDLDETRAKAVAAWDLARTLIAGGDHRLIVLDEVSYPVTWGWIPVADVVDALVDRPDHVSVVLTGRDMPTQIVEAAHTVTEMRKITHSFDNGWVAKRGIDY